jgi:hypothetical protein
MQEFVSYSYIYRVYLPIPLAEEQICHPVAEFFYLQDAKIS